MKFWKHTLVSAFAFLGVTSTVLYTACKEDSCLKLHCLHDATCSDGFCRCVTGWEGSECGQPASNRFVGRFYGFSKCNEETPFIDTAKIYVQTQPNKVYAVRNSSKTDTLFGVISGSHILYDDRTSSGRVIDIYAENNKIKIYVQDRVNGETTQCTFEGTRNPAEL